MTSKYFSCLSLLACVFSITRAETPDTVRLEFTAVTWGAEPSDLFYRSEGKPVPLRVLALSSIDFPLLHYTGPSVFEILRKSISQTGQAGYVVVGTVHLNPACKRALILLTPPPMALVQPEIVTAIALPNDAAQFTQGQIRLANCTPARLAIKCNQQVIELPSGESRIITPDSPQLMLELAAWDGREWRLIANNFQTIPVDARLNAFVYLGGRLGESAPRPNEAGPTLSARDFAMVTLTERGAF